jgi:hypothetical protein
LASENDGPRTVVILTERQGRDFVDSEHPVSSLRELYDVCRRAGAARMGRVLLRGAEGEVRLHFGTYIDDRNPR